MTEEEWLNHPDPLRAVLTDIPHLVSDRKLRLLACAGCRDVWVWMSDPRSRFAVEIAERYADGEAADDALRHASSDAWTVANEAQQKSQTDYEVSCRAFHVVQSDPRVALVDVFRRTIVRRQRRFVLDVMGNPFRPVEVDPSWLTSDVRTLADGIYQERAFDRLPILADALMDAGCDDIDLLNHCRQTGEHVRGCWVVDLLTGRM